jgi:hypothetical protein
MNNNLKIEELRAQNNFKPNTHRKKAIRKDLSVSSDLTASIQRQIPTHHENSCVLTSATILHTCLNGAKYRRLGMQQSCIPEIYLLVSTIWMQTLTGASTLSGRCGGKDLSGSKKRIGIGMMNGEITNKTIKILTN